MSTKWRARSTAEGLRGWGNGEGVGWGFRLRGVEARPYPLRALSRPCGNFTARNGTRPWLGEGALETQEASTGCR